jgi:hypothetical protein
VADLRVAGALVTAMAAAVAAPSWAAPPRIGEALEVVPAARNETAGVASTLSVGSSVYSDDLLITETSGRTKLEFLDRARFELGPNSRARLDRLVFNPDSSAEEATISMAKGLFRFISGGRSRHGSYTLSTPHVTLGIRGTDLRVSVTGFQTFVQVTEGLVVACSSISGRCLELTPPNGDALFYRDGRAVLNPKRPPPGGPGRGGGGGGDPPDTNTGGTGPIQQIRTTPSPSADVLGWIIVDTLGGGDPANLRWVPPDFLDITPRATGSATPQAAIASPNPTPLPPALVLFASALAALGFLGMRRRRDSPPLP